MSRDTPRPGFGTRRTLSTAALLHSARYSGGLGINEKGVMGRHSCEALVEYGLNPSITFYLFAAGKLKAPLHREEAVPAEVEEGYAAAESQAEA